MDGEKWNIVHLAPTETPTLSQITDLFNRFHIEQIAIQILIYLIGILTAWIILAVIFKIIIYIRHLKEPAVLLEITPPKNTHIPAVSTVQLFNLISGILEHQSFWNRLSVRQTYCSLEMVSQKEKGIRFFLKVPKSIANSIDKTFRVYAPGIKIKESEEYLPDKIAGMILNFKFSRHFAFPISEHTDLKNHDPIAYLASNISELDNSDIVALHIGMKPIGSQISLRHKISDIRQSIKHDRFADWYSRNDGLGFLMILASILDFAARIIVAPLLFLAEFVTGHEGKLPDHKASKAKETTEIKELKKLAEGKLSEPLFACNIKALVFSAKAKDKAAGIITAFSNYNHPAGQAIVPKSNILRDKRIDYWHFKNRLSSNPNLVLSSSELASIYHFPFSDDTIDFVKSMSRELPAPLSQKQTDHNFDVILGVNKYGGKNTPIGLTLSERQKHMYLIGKTGMGKTTLLKNSIFQDMLHGKGLAVFDPHGDLLQELLAIIPENRKNDVVVFDPSDRDWPIGLNILSPGIKFSNKEDQDEWITSAVIGIFAKITAKEYWGPRMEHILRNATLTALQTENPSLWTLQRLLTDKGYQKNIAMTLKDPVLKQFWNKEFSLLGKMQLSNVTSPLTQRLGGFITTKMSRHILLQEKSTISISQIMDEGKILLVNLSKGDLGEDMSFFFGVLLTSLIWMAAYQRTKIREIDRKDFFLYVDEFQNFATPRFAEITSEGRKYHVSLIASHQNLAQVEDKDILKVVAGNASAIVCLKASPDDEKFILPFMEPEVEKGDIVNLPPYRFFMKLTNEKSENAFSGITVPLNVLPNDQIKNEALAHSRQNNATPRREVEEFLNKLFTGRINENQKPITEAKSVKKKSKAEPQMTLPEQENDFGKLS